MTGTTDRTKSSTKVIVVALAAVIAAGGVGFNVWSTTHLAAARSENLRATEAAAEEAAKIAAREEKLEEIHQASAERTKRAEAAIATGFEAYDGNGVFWRDAGVPCDDLTCFSIEVLVIDPCPGGVHIAGDVKLGGATVGESSEITSPLPVMGTAIVRLESPEDADSLQFTKMSCLS